MYMVSSLSPKYKMFTALYIILVSAVKLSVADFQYNTLTKTSVNMNFSDTLVVNGAMSKLDCAVLCDRHSSCLAIRWDDVNSICEELSRDLTPETILSQVSIYTELYVKYVYIAGTLVKYVRDPGNRLPWQDAQNYCVSDGGRLLVIDTPEKYQAVKSHNELSGLWWVGATLIDSTWTLTTGETLNPTIPIVIDDTFTCLSFFFGNLHDSNCSWAAFFICEK